MKCPKCGKEIANDSCFCEYCGVQVVPEEKIVQEGLVHVRWFLFVAALLVCLMNALFFDRFIADACDEWPRFDTSILWIAPGLSLIIFVFSIVLSKRKKLKAVYTVLIFLILSINTAIPICAENNGYSTISYKVSVELYENGEYLGYLVGHHYGPEKAQKVKKMFNNMVLSSKHKYRSSTVSYKENNYSDAIIDIECWVFPLWYAEALVFLIYLVVASVASKKEKKK